MKNFLLRLKTRIAALWQAPRPATENGAAAAGEWGEGQAAKFLQRNGWRILERRARPSRRGEIDLVATAGETLVFVEVKTRRNEDYGSPRSSVGFAKRRALNRAAIRWLRRARWPKLACRFDIVEVIGSPLSKTPPVIRHIEGAFPFEQRWMMPPR